MNSNPTPDIPDFLPVDHCPGCGLLIDVGSLEPLTQIACPDCNTVFPVQSQLGQFTLLKVAGKGGMGVVYRAFDSELNREVALKLLKREQSADPGLVAKLDTEATITAAVNHPNVVRVFSTGMAHSRFYIAMELVDKGSLESLIQMQGAVSEAQALLVGIQAAAGLQAAKEHGLIHRDIKPANILFATASLAKLVDFGLAISQSEEESVRGEIWGTPFYIAPEKIEGKPEDFRSDIYSLGGTLFHAITGRPPFDGPDASTIALKHLQSPPVRIQSFAPHVSKRTAYVIDRMLHKDPEQRYQSYDELIEHLQYARNELVNDAAGPKKVKPLVVEAPEENRAASWFTAAALLIFVLGFLFRGVLFQKQAGQRAVPETIPASLVQAQSEVLSGAYSKAVQTLLKTIEEPGIPTSARIRALFLLSSLEIVTQSNLAPIHLSSLRLQASKIPPEKSDLAPVLSESASILLPGSHPSELNPSDIRRGNLRSLLLFSNGLRDWSMGNPESASAYLRDFRLRAPTSEDPWIRSVAEIGNQLADAFESFRVLETQFRTSVKPWDQRNLAACLRDFPEPIAERVSKIKGLDSFPPSPKTLASFRRVPRLYVALDTPSIYWVPKSGFWSFNGSALLGTQPPGSNEPARSSLRKSAAVASANTEIFAPVKARTLRFTIHQTSALQPAIDEFEAFDGSGKNVALASEGTTASASGSITPKDQPADIYSPVHTIDGIPGNSSTWVADKPRAWLELDFGQEREIQRVVWSRDREGRYGDRLPTAYDLVAQSPSSPPVVLARCAEPPSSLELGDFVAAWAFSISDAKSASFRLENDANPLFQASFSLSSATVEIAPNTPSATTALATDIQIAPNSWHVCVLEVVGNRATLSLDNKLLGSASDKVFSQTKSVAAFTVSGGSAQFRTLTLWDAIPKPEHLLPEELRSAVQASPAKSPR
jgi:serine/threonine protein kinase